MVFPLNDLETTQKTVEKTVEKIIAAIKRNPKVTQKELMTITGLSRRGVEWNLQKLKKVPGWDFWTFRFWVLKFEKKELKWYN